jgi:hypothetical protein
MPNAYSLTLFCMPIAFAVCVLHTASAWRRARLRAGWFALATVALAHHAPIVLLGVVAAALECGGWTDWLHMFWSLQITLVCLFVASGPALSSIAHARHDPLEPHPFARPGPSSVRAWMFLALIAALAVLPIGFENLWPDPYPPLRASGAPGSRIVQLASFGLGGEIPPWLVPGTDLERQRGLAHLARELTVPMGTLLIGAWAIIAFCTLALLVRWCVALRWRDLVCAWAPPGVALGVALAPTGWIDLFGVGFDPGWFGPFSAQDSGMWRSHPVVLRGFGPVIAAAAAAALVLASAQLLDAWLARRRAR